MTEGITPSQTLGPFFNFALTPNDYAYPALVGNDLRTDDALGEPIRIEGRVLDGSGTPVPDAMVEIWQADGAGRYPGDTPGPTPNAAFKGFGRAESDRSGAYRFTTVKPGSTGADQAPHINVGIFARGLLKRLFTRIYFDDEAANGDDAILALVPADRRRTLLAPKKGSSPGMPVYVFDIVLQGDNETVFFEA